MCGIAGIYNFRSSLRVDPSTLEGMANAMQHRGPDDQGVFTDRNLGLAHRRLSIIDLDSGHQPMAGDRGNVVVFNGEIYNYLELREGLGGDRVFRTHSDTEVILHAYQAYGLDCVQHFRGMFAFALWDGHRLVLARDRMGIKPLYYALTPSGLVFASEIRALLESGQIEASLEPERVGAYMAVGYVPGEQTLFKGVRKLPPATLMSVDARGVTTREYWDVRFSPRPISGRQAEEQFRDITEEAVELRLRSDVPLGVFLSGGLDSSAMVALLAPKVSQPLETFSVYYQMPGFNETRYARMVADRYGTVHREIEVTPKMFLDFLPDYIRHMDEPVTEAAGISLYYVAKLARESVTVVLSGEGADEILAGYEIYGYMRAIERYRGLPHALRRALDALWRRSRNPRIRKYASLAQLPLEERYRGVSMYDPSDLSIEGEPLMSGDMRAYVEENHPFRSQVEHLYEDTEEYSDLSRMLYLDMKTWLVDDILLKADKMSMAASVELRVPFLDHRLVEFCASLPDHLNLRGFTGKRLLRSVVGELLPKPIIARKKMGFPTPLEYLFRKGLYTQFKEILLDGQTARHGIFSPRAIEKLLKAHERGQDHHKRLWQILVLELWQRTFLDGARA